MQHQHSVRIPGDPARALEFAVAVLASVGFRITRREPNAAELRGPGFKSSHENSLRGASAVRLRTHFDQLTLDAELGGVEWMGKFLFWFPTLLCFGLGVVLSIVFYFVLGPGNWFYLVVAVVAADGILWNFLGPYIARRLETRTRTELDTLLVNAAAASG
jgi:hypothetical protein